MVVVVCVGVCVCVVREPARRIDRFVSSLPDLDEKFSRFNLSQPRTEGGGGRGEGGGGGRGREGGGGRDGASRRESLAGGVGRRCVTMDGACVRARARVCVCVCLLSTSETILKS